MSTLNRGGQMQKKKEKKNEDIEQGVGRCKKKKKKNEHIEQGWADAKKRRRKRKMSTLNRGGQMQKKEK